MDLPKKKAAAEEDAQLGALPVLDFCNGGCWELRSATKGAGAGPGRRGPASQFPQRSPQSHHSCLD